MPGQHNNNNDLWSWRLAGTGGQYNALIGGVEGHLMSQRGTTLISKVVTIWLAARNTLKPTTCIYMYVKIKWI